MSRRDAHHPERAQAAVELAAVLPILVLLLSGIYVLGQAFTEMQQISGAASEGARIAIVSANSPTRDGDITDAVREAAQLNGLDPAAMDIDVASGWVPGDEVKVTVTYPMEISLGPFAVDRTVERSRTMRVLY